MSDVLKELKELHPKMAQAHWTIQDGKLMATIGADIYEFEFERGDPISEAVLLFLNNSHFILTVLEHR